MNMSSAKRIFTTLAAGILATACLGFGSWGMHRSRSANITLASTTTLNNGATLPAGTYRMRVAENAQTPTVMFYKENSTTGYSATKPAASTTAQVVSEAQKNQRTVIDSVARGNAQLLRSISPRGWHEELQFTTNATPHS